MIAGHFGLAAAVKSQTPEIPIWSLMLATAWLDVVFIPLYAAGIETIEPVLGTEGGFGNSVIHADYTHSLLGAVVLSAVFGLAFAYWWGMRAGRVLGAVAFSHWLLDLVVHRADMPLLPGNLGDLPLLGLGLWRIPAAEIVVELALVLAGTYLYWRTASRVVAASGERLRSRANLVSGLILVSGIAVLVFDVTGIIG